MFATNDARDRRSQNATQSRNARTFADAVHRSANRRIFARRALAPALPSRHFRNADAATAYFEAVACVYGVENARAMRAYERLASVNAFECADKALVFGVMDVFQGLATSARGEETRASLEASGALRDFIARSLITATAQESDASLDKPMAKRFFAFLLEALRAKDERFAALAFEGVVAASAPVVSRLCLSLAGSEPSAAAVYQEIKRLENGRVA